MPLTSSGNASSSAIKAGEAFFEVTADDTGVINSLKRVGNRITMLGQTLRNVGVGATAIGAGILTPLASLGALAVKSGADVFDLAEAFGETAEAVTRLQFAAGKNNVTTDELKQASDALNISLMRTKDGSAETAAALDSLGLTAKQLESIPLDERFALVASRLDTLAGPAQRSKVLLELFGSSAESAAKMFGKGASELNALYAEANNGGYVTSTRDAKTAKDMADAFNKSTSAVKNLLLEIGSAFLGTSKAAGGFTNQFVDSINSAREWVAENRELVRLVALIAAGMVAGGASAAVMGSALANAFNVASMFGGALVKVLSLVATGVTLFANFAIPLGIIAGGVALVTLGFAALKPLFETIGKAASYLYDSIISVFSKFPRAVLSGFRTLGGWVRDVFDSIKGFIFDTFKGSLNQFNIFAGRGKEAFQELLDTFNRTFGGIVAALQRGDLKAATEIAFKGLELGAAQVQLKIAQAQKESGLSFSQTWNNVIAGWRNAWNMAIDFVAGALRTLWYWAEKALAATSDALGTSSGWAAKVDAEYDAFLRDMKEQSKRELDALLDAEKRKSGAIRASIDADISKAQDKVNKLKAELGALIGETGAGFFGVFAENIANQLKELQAIQQHEDAKRATLGNAVAGTFSARNYAMSLGVGPANDYAKKSADELLNIRGILQKIEKKPGAVFQ